MCQLADPASWSPDTGLDEHLAQISRRHIALDGNMRRIGEVYSSYCLKTVAAFLGVTTQEVTAVFTAEELESSSP